ncbi:ABA4-like family protein [Candidatus Pelagibacter sp.]|nr:ABA4-like family protein [Candidatus Pelagibacter sp.]
MIELIYNYFTIEMLYYWINLGVLPFWLILIFFPQSHLCKYFVTSVFPILILSSAYVFILYKSYLNSYDFNSNFSLYYGIGSLSDLFSEKDFLIMFWIHFISVNLFVGGWIVKESQRLSINKVLSGIVLVITYLIGPLGLFIYWLIRIFYAKNFRLYD